jgi:hypothetical protein
MKQSRRMSLVESLVNVAVGLHVAVVTQIAVFPLFGLHASLSENLAIGAIFTGASIARSYALRRLFETIRVVGAGRSSRRHGADQSAVPDVSAGAASR